jgi:hypothetical protein
VVALFRRHLRRLYGADIEKAEKQGPFLIDDLNGGRLDAGSRSSGSPVAGGETDLQPLAEGVGDAFEHRQGMVVVVGVLEAGDGEPASPTSAVRR